MRSITAADARGPDVDAAIEIRDVRTLEEFAACVELQAATWGPGFREMVPATILRISQRLGGVTAGAFTPDGALAGFVFGITGIEDGAVVHWSDMLAVRHDIRDHGLGARLKAYQRQAVRAVGATRMYWTYDPLVARNAHFNVNRLGVRVAEYVQDMYGPDTGSAMHSGFGTDRFVVAWDVTPAGSGDGRSPDTREGSPAPLPDSIGGPVLNRGGGAGVVDLPAGDDEALPPAVQIEIPLDIFAVQTRSGAEARGWRASTREAFQWAFARGYAVEQFVRDTAGGRGLYLVTRRSAHPDSPMMVPRRAGGSSR